MLRLPILIAFALSLNAQTETGVIRGLVVDESGAGVARSMVVCRNLETSVSRTTQTNDLGAFELSYLPAGRYEIRVSKENFKEAVVREVILQVNQSNPVKIELELGPVTEQVTVQAESTLLQADPAIGSQLDQKNIVDLPGRSFASLIALSTGVAQLHLNGFGGNSLSQLQPGRGNLNININFGGYRQTGNYYMLDGISNTDWNINAVVTTPSAESLQELRVQTGTSSAAFGQVPGGTVNMLTRSGSNSLHGEFYDYLRNDKLDARPYNFNPGTLPKPPLRLNQFGAAMGGPLQIPRLYQGRNRTFFFANYEGALRRSEIQSASNIPTAAARQGDVNDYGRAIFDPLSVSDGARSPFAGNSIPRSRFDSVAIKMLDLMPQPTQPGARNNFVKSRSSVGDNHQVNLRVDHQLSSRDFLYGSYHLSDEQSNTDSAFGPITGTTVAVRSQNATVSYTRVFRANLLNHAKFGFNRLKAVDGVYNAGKRDIIGELGIEGIDRDPLNWGFPAFQVGIVLLITDSATRPTNQRDNLYQAIDDVTFLRGRHSFQAGGEVRRTQFNFRQSNPARGQFRYTGAFTAGPDAARPAQNTGLEFADFLLGFPLQASRIIGVPQGYLRSSYLAGYIGDTIRLRPRLTLILGLRYDYLAPPTEARNNYFNLDFSTLPQPPRLVRVGVDQSSLPERGINSHRADFSPRFGLAFQPASRTLLRAAYGVYHVQEIGAIYYNLVRNGVKTEINDSSPVAPQLTTKNAFNNPRFGAPSYGYIDPNSQTPYVQQWNFSAQRELPWQSLVEAIYAGSKGTKLFRYRTLNTVFQTETGRNLDPRPGNFQQLRTFPSLGAITGNETSSNSIYHSLQLRLEKRFSSGVSFVNSFTWSKSIDDSNNPVLDFYQSAGAQDERNFHPERGLSSFDVRKRFTSAVVLELPFGKRKLFGSWQVSSILTLQDGYPQNLVNFATLSTIGTQQRPNVVAGKHLVLAPDQRPNSLQYYDPSAITVPGPFELGNAGRNIGPTPGAGRVDLAVFRAFLLPWESHQILFRADFFNVFNMINFGIPSPGPTSFNFGQLVTVGDTRTITLSLKYRF